MSDKKKTSYSNLTGFRRAVPIILFAVAVFIALCFITQQMGSLGPAISGVLLGLFSWGAYAIPALIALHALFYPSDVAEKRVLSRVIFSLIAVISLSAFAHTMSFWQNESVSFSIGEFYRNGQNALGGGAIGSTVGYGIVKALGSIGLIIVAVTVFAIYVSYFFARGKRGISKVLYTMLKGIVFFCAAVEKRIKKLFGNAKKSKSDKKQKEAEEKGRALMEDEFFDVDNGIERLEISELGISETRDRASVEEHATLRDKVRHKSDATPEEAAEMERRARERAAASAMFYDDVTAGAFVDSDAEEDGKFISGVKEDKSAAIEIKPEGDDAKEAEPSADEIFTSEFDPYAMAMSEKLASKPSSRSLLDDKPSVTEHIPEITEADAERARRNEEFERRKAAVIAASKGEAEENTTPAKTVEYRTEEPERIDAPTVSESESVSVVIEKPTEVAPEPAPTYTVDNPYVSTVPAVEKKKVEAAPADATTKPVEKVETGYGGDSTVGARATYRRAAGFAVNTFATSDVKHEPMTESIPTAVYNTEPKPAVTYGNPSASVAFTEPAAKAEYTDPVTVTESPKEPKKPSYVLEESENVYTPSFSEVGAERSGEYATEEKAEAASGEFKELRADAEGGFVFEIDMGKTNEPEVLVTETTHYGDEDAEDYAEDDAESEEVAEEVTEDEVDEEEIPPEKRNPFVSEMRDMFPALRQEAKPTAELSAQEEAAEDESEENEDEPPFDEPTGVTAPVQAAPKEEKAEAAEKVEKPKPKPNYKNYKKPPLEIMALETVNNTDEISQEIRENTNIIIETLASFNVVASIKGVDRGPRITRYEVVPAKGVKVNQITNLLDNITMNLAAEGIRMEAPIPGKSAIGFEIPNKNPSNVCLRELLECEEFINAKSNTFVCIGKDVAGNPVFGDIGKFPHALVAGATGMGKSVCINSIMISLLYKARPDQVKFIMIDPKKVEFRMYSGIPHLLIPVITEAKQAAGALMWAVDEMERRYSIIEQLNIRNIDTYNEKQALDPSIGEHLPKIVIVIDELNDLMMQVRDPVEDLIMRIAQKARAAGIHLIIGTQRPDVKVITGTIKANINTRISCKVTSVVDSRTILEMAGAEKLLNRGDMLFKPVDKTKPIRVQGAFVSDDEVEAIMEFLKSQSEGAQYDDEIFAEINKAAQKCGNKKGGGSAAEDDEVEGDSIGYYNDQKFLDAVELAIRSGKISTSLLQRKMSIGYGKAAKYIDAMEEIGVVSEANGQKPRDVLITMDQWYDKLSRVDIG